MISKNLSWSSTADIQTVAHALNTNQIIIGSTDTVFGLMAPVSETGKNALDALKQRSDKPYIILIGTVEQIPLFSKQPLNQGIETLLKDCWPGPLTIILQAAEDLPDWLRGPRNTIGLRVPAHSGLQTLLQSIPAVFSTSANISGQPIPTTLSEVNPTLLSALSYAIFDEKTQPETPQPSTILDLSQNQPQIVRKGAGHEDIARTIKTL